FKAEAFAALNRIPEAINELNIVRNRAGIGNYTGATDQISVEREILRERGRELYLERKRWPDLLRFHFGGTIDIYDEVPNLKAKREEGSIIPLYLAIPLRDLDLNPNLTQTEGYEDL
ncbi:MAG: RagB/SusD family nutrient uptake outer membrane protein, partial [Proteiniphilum sp.]